MTSLKKRTSGVLLVWLSVFLISLPAFSHTPLQAYDIVIKNGRVVDGTGNARTKGKPVLAYIFSD